MNRFVGLCAMMLLTLPLTAAGQKPVSSPARLVARGKYLVDKVAMCGDCHSPRDEKGEFIPARLLQGTALDFQPTHPVPGWAAASPPIAGLDGWTSAEAVRFLMTGVRRDGKPAAPPMPQYRLSRRDAEAVTAYLKSLAPEAR